MTSSTTSAADSLRKAPTENQHIELVAQVDSVCPRCSTPLLRKIADQRYKHFEVAHIYPLNPTPTERELLAAEPKLATDPNDLANLIPLCKSCHGEFDKPRTLEGYRQLVAIKRHAVEREEERSLWHRYPLERELASIVEALATHDLEALAQTTLDVQSVDFKTQTAPPLTRNKIRSDVRDYFTHVQQLFHQLERTHPGTSDLVAQQVRAYYLAQRRLCTDKKDLYDRVAHWIQRRIDGCSSEAAEVLASFFVQNCEVLG